MNCSKISTIFYLLLSINRVFLVLVKQVEHNKTKKLLLDRLIDFRKLFENAKAQEELVSNVNNKDKSNLDKNREVEHSKDKNKVESIEEEN